MPGIAAARPLFTQFVVKVSRGSRTPSSKDNTPAKIQILIAQPFRVIYMCVDRNSVVPQARLKSCLPVLKRCSAPGVLLKQDNLPYGMIYGEKRTNYRKELVRVLSIKYWKNRIIRESTYQRRIFLGIPQDHWN